MQHQATHARKDDGESNRVLLPLRRIATAWRSLVGLRGGIGLRLLVRVLLFSLVITLLLTLMQLYLDYRRDVRAIDERMSEIDSGYRRSLGEGLWRLDSRQLQLQAEGILHLPDIRYVELREATDRAAPLVVTAGSRQENPPVRREFRIFYTNHGAEQLVGILVVEATFDRIYHQLFDTAAVILVGQAIMTFIVSFFVLLIVHRLITRHLTGIATSLRGYDLHGSQAPLRLDRRRPGDELDRLVEAFNDMYARLQAAYGDLAEREARIRRLVDSDIIGIFVWDFDGRILEANDEFLRMVGYGREDLLAGSIRWAALTPPEWLDRDAQLIQEHMATGSLQPFEKEYFRKDGSRIPVLIGVATFEEGGNQGVAFVLDLTERKRAEERLRVQHTVAQILADAATIEEASPRLLRAMGECLGWDVGALWRVDREAGALRCVELWHKASIEVPEFERVSREFTFGPGLGLPGRVWSSLAPEYIPDVVPDENFPRAPIAEREGLHAAFGFPILLGGEVLGVIEFFSREIRQPDQELLNVLATIGSQIGQFIERKRAEAALRDSERSLRSTIDGIAGLVAIMAPNGELDALNRQVIDYFGRSLEEMKNWGTSDAVHPEDLPRIAEVFQRSIASGTPFHYELRLRRFDGEYRWFDNRCVPIREKSGRVVRWYMLGTDIEERKRAEQALRKSEARIRRLVDSNIIGIFIWDFDGRILEANDEFLRMVNYDREDLVSGRIRWADLTPPGWRDRNNARIERQKSSGRFEPFEKEYTRRDGSRVPVLIGGATFEEGGNQGVAFVLDLTERKRAEEELRKSEAKFSDYAATASDWLWEIDPDYRFTLLTENAFHSDSADRIGTFCWDHSLDLKTEPEKWRLVFATFDSRKPLRDFVYCSVDGSGAPMYVKASGKPVFDANGEFRGYRGTGTDVTAIIRAEYLTQQMFERSSDCISIVGRDYRYQRANPAFGRRWGMPAETIVGMHVADLLGMASFEQIAKAYLDRCFAGEEVSYVDWLTTPLGRRYSAVTYSPLRPESERVEAALVIIRDLTEHMLASEALREAQLELAHVNRVATMGQLTSSIAHEVNQPITAAVTYALAGRRWLNAQPPNLREVDDALSLIVKEGNRAGEVVGRIRALIKKAPARKDAVEINDAILEVVALSRTEAANNSVSVRTQLAEGLPRVQGDRVQLQQVLLNLIINAIEAMRDVGEAQRELLISTRHEPDGVSVEVRDSGPGFEPAALERVFEAFYTTKSSGLGLGLSICRSIIEAHDGRLWASPNVPRGAILSFIVPAHSAAS